MPDILSWDKVLAARLRHEDVDVPEFGGTVRVWELSALQKLEASGDEKADPRATWVRLVAASIGDEKGARGFPVEAMSSDIVARLTPVVSRLMRAPGEEQPGNSSGGPSGASPTGSP